MKAFGDTSAILSLALQDECFAAAQRDLFRRRLVLPLEKRLNFLRRRLPGGGSCL